jgi:hypothetical protein
MLFYFACDDWSSLTEVGNGTVQPSPFMTRLDRDDMPDERGRQIGMTVFSVMIAATCLAVPFRQG